MKKEERLEENGGGQRRRSRQEHPGQPTGLLPSLTSARARRATWPERGARALGRRVRRISP